MNPKWKIYLIAVTMIFLASCESETHLINIVHKDGSVTRQLTVKTDDKKNLKLNKIQVPIDSTWAIQTSFDLNEKNDTIWLLTAEKYFANVDEINQEYNNDKGSNRALKRRANFAKTFKWFTTEFRYTETIEKTLNISCPVSDFLTKEELDFFYMPDKISGNLKNGPDSLTIRAIADSIEVKSEMWLWTCEIRQWIEIFYDLFGDDPKLQITKDEMKSKELQFAEYLMGDGGDDEGEDSIFISVLGQNFFSNFKTEIDSALTALNEMDSSFWMSHNYDMEIRMPGKLISSNGYAEADPDSENVVGMLWTVKGEYFLAQTYEMWAISKVNNYFAWVISALFILFVITGLVRNSGKKGE